MKLLERASQLQALNSALSQVKAREGQGCIALVYGEAGIGKTSLVEYFIKTHKHSWRILQGACDSLFTPRPLGPLHDIAMQLEGELPVLLNSNVDRHAIFSAFLVELQNRPTIVVFEDIHWADEATVDLLKYLGRRIRQTVSLLIITYRDDESGVDHPLRILLGDLASSHALYHIPVHPLSKAAVHELAGGKNIDHLEVHRLTNGNPFFVTEVLAVEAGIPETVRDAVLARAARLSPLARAVLEAVAVIGSRAEAWLLSNVTGAESTYVEECTAKGMLQIQNDYYAFRHELARQTILESISPQRKIALHRMILTALIESPETRNDLARLANHAEGTKDSNAVLEYAPIAARQASALGAHRQAAAHYKITLQFASLLSAERRAELLDSYSDECEVNAQMIEAKNAQQEALSLWQELGWREKEGRALRRLSELAMRLNQKPEMERYISEALIVLEALPPSKELAMVYSHKSRIHMVVDQADETIYWGIQAMNLAEQFGDIETLSHALTNIGSTEASHGQYAEGQIKLERSLRLSLDHDYHHHAGRTFYNLASGFIDLYKYETCLTYVNEGMVYCTKHDLDIWRRRLLSLRARVLFEQGHWAELETLSDIEMPLLRLYVRRGYPISPEVLDSLHKTIDRTVFQEVAYPIATLLAEMAWLRGDLAQCRLEVESMFHVACQANIPREMGELAYWMWRAGVITEPPANAAEPYVTQISGDWRTAASMWEKFGCPYEQGMALMDGDETAQLAALEIFERLGARPIIEKLKAHMRAQGIRIPRGPRPATRENPFGLTAREMEVVKLITQGKSNREIARVMTVGEKTVETYVTRILGKLNFESRIQIATWAIEKGLFSSTRGN